MALCQPGVIGRCWHANINPQTLFLLFLLCTRSTTVHALLVPTIYVHASSTLHHCLMGSPTHHSNVASNSLSIAASWFPGLRHSCTAARKQRTHVVILCLDMYTVQEI